MADREDNSLKLINLAKDQVSTVCEGRLDLDFIDKTDFVIIDQTHFCHWRDETRHFV